MSEARLHDGSAIEIVVRGTGPTLLMPVSLPAIQGRPADKKSGADRAMGWTLVDVLSEVFRVVAFDYAGHNVSTPKPDSMTPANIVRDFLSVADVAGADRFAYYGYSWLAMSGLQLAIRTDRVPALIMGGFPPIDGPYGELLHIATANYELAASDAAGQPSDPAEGPTMTEPQARQAVTLYTALQGFDDRVAQAEISCPRLCFVGSADEIRYNQPWGEVRLDIAGPVVHRRAELEAMGWDVQILEGLDHSQARQPDNVIPVLRPWLASKVGAR